MIRPMVVVALLPVVTVVAVQAAVAAPEISYIRDGTQYVDGKPFIKTAAWWGINHWMAGDPDKAIGNQLALPDDQVGAERDFYARCGFSAGYFTIVGDDVDKNLKWLRLCLARAQKTGEKIVIHIDCKPTPSCTQGLDYTYVTETGERKPIANEFHYDPQTHAEAMRRRLKPFVDAFRDDPQVIGYQIGGETWAAISYDDASIQRFRQFLKAQFSLEELSLRYGRATGFYADWDAVHPPIQCGVSDFRKRGLPNGRAAWFDWARYNKRVHEDVWVAMIGVFNEVDGRGRPISYEYNHGPYSGSAYGLYNFNFPGICDRVRNFSVGPGEFAYSLVESMHGLYAKTCGQGPWFTNELGTGHCDTVRGITPYGAPAYIRRHAWWTLALGGNGYHFWTFFNLLGAYNEFTSESYYDPVLTDNLPPAYFEAEHCNRMVASLGGLLAGSKAPPLRIGVFYLDDSSMAGYAGSYQTDAKSVMRALAAHGLADQVGIYTEYHLDRLDLSALKAIVLPCTPRLTAVHARKLADYVAQGGTLVMMAPTGKVDDRFTEATTYPTGPLAEACGVRVTDLAGEEVRHAPVAVDWNGANVFVDVRVRLTIPKGSAASALLRRDDQVIATVNRFGKGRCCVLAGKPLVCTDDDPTGAFLVSLLQDARPAAALMEGGRADTGVYSGRRVGPDGTLLMLIENADRAHDLTVKLDPAALGLRPDGTYSVFECFSDEAHKVSGATGWRFTTRLEPVGVRVYLITTAAALDEVLPKAGRLLIPRDDPDATLVARGSSDLGPYRVGDACAGQKENARFYTLTGAEVGAGPPRDLGNGYLGLDLDGFCTNSLRDMLKDVDYSGIRQFGAVPQQASARETLPLKPGVNRLGDVPEWVNGRYVLLGKRQVEGIRVGGRVSSLHFFHHGIFWLHESALGYYQVHYADGTVVRVPIALFSTLSDLDRPWGVSPKTPVIWQARNGNRLSRYDWVNPYPAKVVDTIDIIRNDAADFTVWAITARKAAG